jgi:hypothetical protein
VKLAIPHVWRIRQVRGKDGKLTPNSLDGDALFRRSRNSDDAPEWQRHHTGNIYGRPALKQQFELTPSILIRSSWSFDTVVSVRLA